MKSKKTFLSLITVLSILNSCSTEITNNIGDINSVSISSHDNIKLSEINPAPMLPEILSQINSSKISETEWGVNVKDLPYIKNKKKITLLSYMAFDNDKGGYRDELRKMINFHELSGSSNIMNMILQTDGQEEKDIKRYFITGNKDLNKIDSPYTNLKYELDFSNYNVLKNFAKWGFSTYPSTLKILDIDSHGSAFMGAGVDESSNSETPIISLPNITKAIKESSGKLDLLNFDACLMGSIEVVYQMREVADIVIGSQDSTYTTGMLYTKDMNNIIEKSRNIDDIAKNIILSSDRKGVYTQFDIRKNRKGKLPNVFTISAYKTNKSIDLVNNLNELSRLLIKKIDVLKNQIKIAFKGSHQFLIEEDHLGGQRDLHEILNRLNTTISDKDVKASISNTIKSLDKTILLTKIHNTEKYAQGISINISPSNTNSKYYKDTDFAKHTQWDELIDLVNK